MTMTRLAPQWCIPRTICAERNFVLQVVDARISVDDIRHIIHRQEHAGQNLDDRNEKRQTAETINECGEVMRRIDMFGHLVIRDISPHRRDVQTFVNPVVHLLNIESYALLLTRAYSA